MICIASIYFSSNQVTCNVVSNVNLRRLCFECSHFSKSEIYYRVWKTKKVISGVFSLKDHITFIDLHKLFKEGVTIRIR